MIKNFLSGTEPDNNREECRMKLMKHLVVAAVIASTASLANGSVLAQTFDDLELINVGGWDSRRLQLKHGKTSNGHTPKCTGAVAGQPYQRPAWKLKSWQVLLHFQQDLNPYLKAENIGFH